jgi:GNAT superfamily N-acetyltransferase
MDLRCEWRAPFANAELIALHAQGFGHRPAEIDWRAQVERHSLGWVCAYDEGTLVGFVNVAWDGGVHAFIVDTVVADGARRRGIGTGLLELAARESRSSGCEWLHVDFGEELREFYVGSCGFASSPAGVMALRSRRPWTPRPPIR